AVQLTADGGQLTSSNEQSTFARTVSQASDAGYLTCRPPSTRMVSPVMKSLSISASTAFAISISPPQRPSGVACSTALDSSSVVPGGATIGPGAIAFTRILSAASSSASASASATTPAFAT